MTEPSLLIEPGPDGTEPPAWGSPAAPVRRAVAARPTPAFEIDSDLAFGLAMLAWVAALFVDSPEQRSADLPFIAIFAVGTALVWWHVRRRR